LLNPKPAVCQGFIDKALPPDYCKLEVAEPMVCLVVEGTPSVRESLCYILLSLGVKGLPAANRQEALDLLKSQPEVSIALVDLDGKEVQGEALLRDLRASESLRSLKVIVQSVQSNRELIVKMMEYGVAGYLLKPYQEKEAYAKLRTVLERCEVQNERRRHIRVKPDPDELLRLHFKLSGESSLISGKIVDISVGGVAVELLNPPEPGLLKPGLQIPGIQFTLSGKQFAPPGKVVLLREQLLALHFEFLTVAEKTALARYVFKRIAV
jgi:two-component system chemotaxis response regulator CheY